MHGLTLDLIERHSDAYMDLIERPGHIYIVYEVSNVYLISYKRGPYLLMSVSANDFISLSARLVYSVTMIVFSANHYRSSVSMISTLCDMSSGSVNKTTVFHNKTLLFVPSS